SASRAASAHCPLRLDIRSPARRASHACGCAWPCERPSLGPWPISCAAMARSRELGRGERVIPGLWRRRPPLPRPGVPHCSAWAIRAGDGVVLVDTGMHEPGSMAELERAMAQVGLVVEDVRLLACTHAHIDHWGQAATIRERAGCEFWL